MRTLLLGLVIAVGCTSAPELPFEEHFLEALPEGALARSFRFTRDGRHWGYVRTSGGVDVVVVDGIPGKPLSLVCGVSISEDGKRVAFLAAENTIYRDGVILRKYGNQTGVSFPLNLSGDGRVLAWQVKAEGGGTKTLVDGVEGPTFASAGLPALSEGGDVVAYRAADAEDHWFMVVNGKRVSGSYDLITDPALSHDGRVVAYACEGDKNTLVVSDKRIELPEFPRSVFLSRDGEAWGYLSRLPAGRGISVVTAGGRSEAFDEIGSVEFDPQGRRVAFQARSGERGLVVIGDLKVESPGLVAGPFWSIDGKRVGYGALLGRELWWKVIDVR